MTEKFKTIELIDTQKDLSRGETPNTTLIQVIKVKTNSDKSN